MRDVGELDTDSPQIRQQTRAPDPVPTGPSDETGVIHGFQRPV
jgi:hypothetical protein